jgi:hypothetical protein
LFETPEFLLSADERRRLARAVLDSRAGQRCLGPVSATGSPQGPQLLALALVQAQRLTDCFKCVAVWASFAALEITDCFGAERRIDKGRQLLLAQPTLLSVPPHQVTDS